MSDDLSLPCDVELPYSIPAACQQEPGCFFCDEPCLPDDPCCAVCRAQIDAEFVSAGWTIPKDNSLPSTAKAILDLDRPKISDKQEREASGIARATERLNSGDHRYGFNEWRP